MRKFAGLLGVVGLLAVAVPGCQIPGQPCGLFDDTAAACDPTPTCPADDGEGGAGGDDGAGGEGGDDSAGGASAEGGGNAGVGVGAGGTPGAGVGVGAGDNSSDVGAGAGSGRTVPHSPRAVARTPRHRPHHHGENIGRAVSADCPTPVMIPKAPYLLPLTTSMLRTIAAANGIGVGQTGLAQSRTIGLAFENWVLTSMGQIPRNTTSFMSPERQARNAANGGLPASVIPEFVGGLGLWWSDYGLVGFPESMFFEVKAVTGVMTQSTSRYQMIGLIDVAAMSPAGSSTMPSHPPPAVVFTTTGNTGIGADVLTYATQRGVAIWQQIVEYDAGSANPQNPDLYIELALPLNPSVYGAASVAPMPPLWPHGPLTSPTTPASKLIVPGDPDPAEVD